MVIGYVFASNGVYIVVKYDYILCIVISTAAPKKSLKFKISTDAGNGRIRREGGSEEEKENEGRRYGQVGNFAHV